VPVPNVVGMTEATARTAITDAGLRVSSVTQQSSSTVALGAVISQSPASGQVEGSSAVTLVVSSGPAKSSSSGGGGGATGLLEVLAGLLLLTGVARRRRGA
jgi:beta-lactam-binding protein with PASTA domain